MKNENQIVKRIILLFLCLSVLFTSFAFLVSCGNNNTPETVTSGEDQTTEEISETEKEPDAVITLADIGDSAVIHTELQEKFLTEGYSNIAKYADGEKELSMAGMLKLSFECDIQTDKTFSYYIILVGENPDFSDAKEYNTRSTTFSVTNLKIATTYYWKVCAVYDKTIEYWSNVASFTTEDKGPRNLTVKGVTNVRDIGGWKTEDGYRVKQNLLFRGARLGTSKNSSEITSDGKNMMLKEMKIRTEIDLREVSYTESHLGSSVNYIPCIMTYDKDILWENHEETKHVFEILANEENYPIYFHCTIGTDRTGMIAFLINGLLGVKRTDLYTDYLFSNFGNIGNDRNLSAINNYISFLSSYDGKTLSERIQSYLISIGVTEEEIESIKNILIDKGNN